MKDLAKKTVEEIKADLISGVEDINSLDLAKADHRTAMIGALEARPALLKNVNSSNNEAFLNYAIEKNHEWFVYIKKEQYFDKIAQMFLYGRLTVGDGKKSARGTAADEYYDGFAFAVQKSIDDKTTLSCNYTTPEGDEIYYYDKSLDIPLALKSGAKFVIKVDDAVKLINEIDLNVTFLGEKKIKHLISELLSSEYNSYITEYISKKSEGYYSILASLSELEEGLIKHLNKALSEYGLSVSSVVVKRIAIPKDIQSKIENLAFDIRQRKAEMDADAELAQVSLKNYEAKIAIQSKYPEAEPSLTEYEKDQALKRYLIKTGKYREEQVDRDIDIRRVKETTDSRIDKVQDIIPEIIQNTTNYFMVLFIVFASISLLPLFILLGLEYIGAAFIYLATDILIFGLIAAFNTSKFSTAKKIEPDKISSVEEKGETNGNE